MADDKKLESSSLTNVVPVTVVLAFLANLLYSHLLPYQDERPSNHLLLDQYPVAQDVDARLWQDPFAAVENAIEERETEKISITTSIGKQLDILASKSKSHNKDQIYKGNEPNPGDDITVIAVTLAGGPYQEAAEQRMRRRYAVLSGLANQGATPKDEQHIGYFHPDADKQNKKDLQKNIAFEWWSRNISGNKKILLLWVDELSLQGSPNDKLQALLQQTRLTLEKIDFHYKVIGPNSSSLLLDMLQEFKSIDNTVSVTERLKKKCTYGKQPKFKKTDVLPIVYYSAGATASDNQLLTRNNVRVYDGESVSEYLCNQGVKLYRTTATDNEMMDILVDELDLRQVKYTDHVVILSEWDTLYGRSMPETFIGSWKRYHHKNNDTNKEKSWIIPYSYMRGLDGILPDKGDKTASLSEKKPDGKDLEKQDAGALIESPEGQNQKDYLRRLAENINKDDQEWKDKGESGVAAIGVLGSDVHDKLMILEALRQYFPHKLFFTTDLEATYNHPSKRRKYQSHNLLVASAFGLELRDELQRKIPPFRDSYQTAFFLATLIALEDEETFEEIQSGDASEDQTVVSLNEKQYKMPPPPSFVRNRT